jgi:hypothetical protein
MGCEVAAQPDPWNVQDLAAAKDEIGKPKLGFQIIR